MKNGSKKRGPQTLDMFEVPMPADTTPGSMNYAVAVSNLVAEVLKAAPFDRYEIASQMSRLSGDDISKNMLDAWASPARVDHNIPFYRLALLEEVCSTVLMTDWQIEKRGGRASYGKHVYEAELGKAELIKEQANKRIKAIKKRMGDEE
ncbi:MAG: hypothetical protein M3H12_02650 [Chromatiales bacterium]